jgi:hypothetical protein
MPEEIVARILRLPGYGVYAWEAAEAANTLTLSIRQTAKEPYYICGASVLPPRPSFQQPHPYRGAYRFW